MQARHIPVQHEHEDCWIYCGKADPQMTSAGAACSKVKFFFGRLVAFAIGVAPGMRAASRLSG